MWKIIKLILFFLRWILTLYFSILKISQSFSPLFFFRNIHRVLKILRPILWKLNAKLNTKWTTTADFQLKKVSFPFSLTFILWWNLINFSQIGKFSDSIEYCANSMENLDTCFTISFIKIYPVFWFSFLFFKTNKQNNCLHSAKWRLITMRKDGTLTECSKMMRKMNEISIFFSSSSWFNEKVKV